MKGFNYRTVAAAAALAAIAGAAMMPTAADAQAIHACVTKAGALRISTSCKKGETVLAWNTQGLKGDKGDPGSKGDKGDPGPAGTIGTTASLQHLNIVDGSNKVLASMGAGPNGGASMNFLDNNGKRLVQVGVDDAGKAGGLFAFDGNAFVPGSGVARALFGVQTDTQKFPGYGAGVRGADGTPRVIVGESLDGLSIPSDLFLYDGNGAARTGLIVNPSTDFTGFFNENSSGTTRASMGSGLDDSFADALIWDSDGNVRNGLLVNPSTNFNGFFSRDSTGNNRSLVSSGLDDSYAQALLLDGDGALRNGLVISPSTNFSGFFDQTADGKERSDIGSPLDGSAGGAVHTFGTNDAQTGHLP